MRDHRVVEVVRVGVVAEVGAVWNPVTSKDGWFGMPDNCAIDGEGRLWIATDGNSLQDTGRADAVFFFRIAIGKETLRCCF